MAGRLRIEPYDPDARDADNDGIVQEGTAWERPAGTRLLDEFGNELQRGLTSFTRPNLQIIDADGNYVSYTPTYHRQSERQPERPQRARPRLRSLSDMGFPTVKDLVLPSTKPKPETPTPGAATSGPQMISPSSPQIQRPRYPRTPPAHAMTGRAEDIFGKASTWEEFRAILKDTDIVFLDYETTGIVFDEYGRASSNGRPTQIGAVRMRDGKVIERFNVFVNPGIPMSQWEPWSRDNLTDADGQKLTDYFFDDKPSIAEAHRQLLDFIGEGTILGMQNAVFDDAVLADALERSGIDWKPAGIIDTKEMSSMALPRWTPENPDGPNRVDPKTGETVPSNGLADITRYLGVDLGDKHHSADYDAEATGHVLTRIVDGAIEKNWSSDFLDKEKRDSKLRANQERFNQEIAQFEEQQRAYLLATGQAQPDQLSDPAQPDAPEITTAEQAVREFLRQVESGELPYPLDENEIAEEIFRLREEFGDAGTTQTEPNAEQISDETERILRTYRPISSERQVALDDVAGILKASTAQGKQLPRKYDFGTATPELEQDALDEGTPLSEGERFGVQMLKIFTSEVKTRDGKKYTLEPFEVESVFSAGRAFYIRGTIYDENGDIAGTFSRALRTELKPDGSVRVYVEHDALTIKDIHQGKGLGTAVNSEFQRSYEVLGVESIETNAVSGGGRFGTRFIGATHWPRAGFDWSSDFDKNEYIRVLEYLVRRDAEGAAMPSRMAYVEGLSVGTRPEGPDRRSTAYFASVEEWLRFIDMLERAKAEDLEDRGRVVAGDLVRWHGADDYFAGGEFSFYLIKRLRED